MKKVKNVLARILNKVKETWKAITEEEQHIPESNNVVEFPRIEFPRIEFPRVEFPQVELEEKEDSYNYEEEREKVRKKIQDRMKGAKEVPVYKNKLFPSGYNIIEVAEDKLFSFSAVI